MRVHDVRDVRRTAAKALTQGAQVVRRSTVEWKVSGNCTEPVMVTLTGRPGRKPGAPVWRYSADQFASSDPRFWATALPLAKTQVVRDAANNPIWMDIEARCRKCPACLRARARMWTERAIAELRAASRSWMGSLTLSADQQHLMMCRASTRLKNGAVRWSSLTEDEQLAERHREISREITLWIKRVRKRSCARLRFFIVMERHKSGLPHYHLLVHEGAVPVGKRVLQEEWPLGFSNFKLVEMESGAQSRTARYVAKYLTKANEARVRASVGYGNPPWGIVAPQRESMTHPKFFSGRLINGKMDRSAAQITERARRSEAGSPCETGNVPAGEADGPATGTQTRSAAPSSVAT